ncbi:MAG TPA: hypothetical protein VIO36_08360 [Anaerolineaceae bacterium]
MKNAQRLKTIPLYPLLLALYSPLMLIAANLGEVSPGKLARVLIISLLIGAAVYALLRGLLRSWDRAAPLAAFLLLLFYTYGHVYGLLADARIARIALGRDHALALPWLVLSAVGAALILRWRKPYPAGLHQVLNAVAAVLVGMALYQVVMPLVVSQQRAHIVQAAARANAPQYTAVQGDLPDVYWIILDGYERSDALSQDYRFDNQSFLAELRELGFVIPNCTTSNYPKTIFSITSTVQMNYLEDLGEFLRPHGPALDHLTLHPLLMHNPVRERLDALGYHTYAFGTAYEFANVYDADTYLHLPDDPWTRLTDFEQVFLCTTGLCPLQQAYLKYAQNQPGAVNARYYRRYQEVRFTLDELEKIPALPGRKFVIAHVLAPHDPFVFSAAGEYVEYGVDRKGYVEEARYLNARLLEIIKTILAQSDTPPVIVIQGDHGWETRNRPLILNAYYLPGSSDSVYAAITPVNTFRVILDEYFGGQWGRIEDKSYTGGPRGLDDWTLYSPRCARSS